MGLQDHYDVKLPCHLLLAKLAAAAPGQLLANLHRLTDPLEKTLHTKAKTDAVKQEVPASTMAMSLCATQASSAGLRRPPNDCPVYPSLMWYCCIAAPPIHIFPGQRCVSDVMRLPPSNPLMLTLYFQPVQLPCCIGVPVYDAVVKRVQAVHGSRHGSPVYFGRPHVIYVCDVAVGPQ